MLNIKTVVYLTPNKMEQLDNEFESVHLEIKQFNKELEMMRLTDFTNIVEEKLAEGKGPVLILCVNSFLSGAIAT